MPDRARPARPVLDEVGTRALAHVRALCAPALGGRMAGTDGERRTVRDLLDRLAQLPALTEVQVEPLAVPVPVLDAMPRLRIAGADSDLELQRDFGVAVQGAAAGGERQVATVWAGCAEPAAGWPATQDSALVCWGSPPQPLALEQAFARYLAQVRQARDAGAAALLRVVDSVESRKLMLHRREEPGLPVLEITTEVARALFDDFPQIALGTRGRAIDLSLPLRVEVRESAGNVVVRMGQGLPRLIVCAHHDGVGSLPDGRYFAGAQDNASGVAVLLELLRAIGPELDGDGALIAVFTAAEELGMFGAEALIRNHPDWWPPDPLLLVLDELAGDRGEPLHLLASLSLRRALEEPSRQLPALLRRGPLPTLAFADHLPLLQLGLTRIGIATAPARSASLAHSLADTPERLSAPRLGELVAVLRELIATLWQVAAARAPELA